MGQEIYYCCRCQIQLRSKDFEQGGAVHFNAQAYCAKCAPEEARILPGSPPAAAPRKNKSTTRIPVLDTPSSSRRIPAVPEQSSVGAYGALALVGVLGVAALFWIVSSASSERPPAPPPPVPEKVSVVPPPPPVEPPKPPVPGEAALRKARDYVRSNPSDFTGQAELYEQALPNEEARRELESVRKTARERVAAELAALDPRTREASVKEQFDKALEMIEEARRRLRAPDWQNAIQQRTEAIRRQAAELFAAIKKDALDARSRGQADQVKALQERVARWGLEPLAGELAAALAVEPKPPPVSPDVASYSASWESALQLARTRDIAAAMADLKRAADGLKDEATRKKAADDLETLRQAAQALKELQQIPSKWQKGKSLSVEFTNGAGAAEKVEGTIARLDAHRVELKPNAGDPVVIPFGELRTGTLPPSDARVLEVLRLLEGGPEPAREQEARALYTAAEQAYESPASTADSVQKHATLLKDYADTLFVRRNRPFIQARSQGGRDFFLFPEDMTAGGSFLWVKNARTETCFSSEADTEAGRTKDNFVEIPYSVLPGADYRCWVYVGACCAETFAFSYQVADAVVAAKMTALGLKKTHSLHTGPKAPSRWEWVALPLPKAGEAGPKKIRILTNQEGFSVAFAFISSTKAGPPEIKTQEKARLETPGARPLNRSAPPPKAKPAADDQILVWKIDTQGGTKPSSVEQGTVEKAPDRPDRFCIAGLNQRESICHLYAGEPQGICTFSGDEVLSFEYWVDSSVMQIVFNVYDRTQQKTHASVIDKPVQGKWTRHTIRLADMVIDTPLRVGDLVGGLYMHGYGGPTRKFFVDNVQIFRPRGKK
jgi:hypothetical protein